MRLRRFAALLLAPLALAACDRNPLGVRASLVGTWETDAMHYPGIAPNGSVNVGHLEHWSFGDDGSFEHSNLVVDLTTQRRWVVFEETGSWKASADELRRVARERFVLPDMQQIPPEPVLTPVDPQLERARYELQGSSLLITPSCPPGAMCIAPLPFHRVSLAE